MSDRDGLLSVILENPDDDTARLVLADLLRESDAPADQARGRFLWAGVTAARFRSADLIDDPSFYTAHLEIAAVASAGHPVRWLTQLGIGPELVPEGAWGWNCVHDRVTVRLDGAAAVFARGLLARLTVPLDVWGRTAARVLEATPLESVAASDVPGLSFSIGAKPRNWTLAARLKVPPQRIPLMGGPIPSLVSPSPFLLETDADWGVEESFSTRAELVAAAAALSLSLAQDLREVAGPRWPRPPRAKRG